MDLLLLIIFLIIAIAGVVWALGLCWLLDYFDVVRITPGLKRREAFSRSGRRL
jgi:hypothetical protein